MIETWKATIHRATQDSGTLPYTEVLKTTVAGYTGYSSLDVYTIAQQGMWDIVTPDNGEDVAGNLVHTGTTRRRVFELIAYPHRYNDHATEPDLTDIDTLAAFITASGYYYWISIVGGSRAYPTDTTKCHPVALRSWGESPSFDSGTRSLTMRWEVRSLS